MNPAETPTEDDPFDLDLIAYLDNELDRESASGVERVLADDPAARASLARLERAWEMLDCLPRSEPDEHFTQSTLSMVALAACEDVDTAQRSASRRRWLRWLAVAACLLTASLVGYLITARSVSSENRLLVRELPVIENVDYYRRVDDIQFLEALDKTGLFVEEDSGSEI